MKRTKWLASRWLKLTKWEFWSVDVFYFPVFIYCLCLAARNRSLLFFTASNPAIHFGGMAGASKSEIYNLIPAEYLPEMMLFRPDEAERALTFAKALGYPVIAKPDVGERGRLVEKIKNEAELTAYLERCKVPFLVQEFIDYPLEFGVFYVRQPEEDHGKVTSVVQKDFLSVIGDGESTVKCLLEQDPRASLQLDFDHSRFSELMEHVPQKGEKEVVEQIGNHCRGTTFLNRNDLIEESLTMAIDRISKRVDGFYYGRYDVRCKSVDDLKQLRNFKIIELNGACAEPAHIYHPGYSLFRAYRDVFWHYRMMARIARANRKHGIKYWTFEEGWKMWKRSKAHQRLLLS